MKKNLLLFVILSASTVLFANRTKFPKKIETNENKQAITFTENKGQVSNQYYKPRLDVLYSGNANGMIFHLRTNGISYQLNRVDSWKEEKDSKFSENVKVPEQSTIYRLDINWLNINKNVRIKTDKTVEGYNNYYLEVCPNGIHNVKSYTGVTYKNIYDNIDLHYYEKDGNLKYDYIVAPNADYKQIQLEIKGAEKIEVQSDGSIVFKTPLGQIQEDAPLVYQNNKKLKAKWIQKNNILSFDVIGYDQSLPLVIDPAVRVWGTYYGGSADECVFGTSVNNLNEVLVTGLTQTNNTSIIATVGAFQAVFGGATDAYILKFDNNGSRIWATYYGGNGYDKGYGCIADNNNDIYMVGETSSSSGTVIATSPSHQNTYGGGTRDGFIIKFNTNGQRIWGTYYGGSGDDIFINCTFDQSNFIFVTGRTTTPTSTLIATLGSHQSSFGTSANYDAVLVKFDLNGLRLWSTYYGGTGGDTGYDCATDASGNVFLSGYTNTNTGTVIATVGSQQTNFNGGAYDGFIAKFNSAGVRQWGTYYGGAGDDFAFSCTTNTLGFVYLCGRTDCLVANIISTAGSYQSTFGGSFSDAFLAKFNTLGVRQWATYYGGISDDSAYDCYTNSQDETFLLGSTATTLSSIFTTPNNYQVVQAGSADGFLTKFDAGGTRQWGTYLGGEGYEYAYVMCVDASQNIFISGSTTTTNTALIATTGAQQTSYAGGTFYGDAFTMKLKDCNPPNAPVNTSSIQTICSNNNLTLSVSSPGIINWYSSYTSTTSVGSGSIFVTPTLTTAAISTTLSYFASSTNTCTEIRTEIPITILPSPTITVNTGTTCAGQSFTINPSGANTYTFSSGNAIVTPTTSTSYSISGTGINGCVTATPAISNITVNALPIVNALTTNSLICTGQSATLTSSGANTFTWNTTSTTTAIVVTPTVNTTYTVTGTDVNGCNNFATVTQSVSLCTGNVMLSGVETNSIKIYPNPSTGIFNINCNTISLNMHIEVVNALGQLLFDQKINSENTSIDLSKYAKAIYYLKVIGTGKQEVFKIIKE